MALTIVESLVLWGVPVVTILVTIGIYVYWGREAEQLDQPEAGEPAVEGGEA